MKTKIGWSKPVRPKDPFSRARDVRRARQRVRPPTTDARPAWPADEKTNFHAEKLFEAQLVKDAIALSTVQAVAHAKLRGVKARMRAGLRMTRASVEAVRVRQRLAEELAFLSRIRSRAPELVVTEAPWKARVLIVGLILGSVILTASGFALFEPPRTDTVTRGLDAIGLSPTWLLALAQQAGFAILSACGAVLVQYAIAPKLKRIGRPAQLGPADPDPDGELRIVRWHLSPLACGVLAFVLYATVVAGAFAVAEMRNIETAIGGALGSSAPGQGAVGSLSGAAPAGGENHTAVFMALSLAEIVAASAVMFILDPACARVQRKLKRATDRAVGRLIRAGESANRSRADVTGAALDANAMLTAAGIHAHQAEIDAGYLDAIRRGENEDVYGSSYAPEFPEMPILTPDLKPLEYVDEAPPSYPHDDDAPLLLAPTMSLPGLEDDELAPPPGRGALHAVGDGPAIAYDLPEQGAERSNGHGSLSR